jgi:hypothetical protein
LQEAARWDLPRSASERAELIEHEESRRLAQKRLIRPAAEPSIWLMHLPVSWKHAESGSRALGYKALMNELLVSRSIFSPPLFLSLSRARASSDLRDHRL